MARADWTYELPPGGGDTAGLEDYVAYTAEGEPAGKVTTLLRRGESLYLVVDRGTPPLSHDRRAIPWDSVETVDHEAVAVRIGLRAAELDEALELDPGKAVEPTPGEESAPAAAVRVVDVPAGPALPEARGPADRTLLYGAALGLGLVAVLAFLIAVVLVAARGSGLVPFFAVPAALAALAGFLVLRLWRRPYEGPPEGRGPRSRA